ncbi:CTP--phosphocholine cytidylyltransferase [Clostridium botulinum]|uniref:CTP--phosphocholine cytidylyltransferase n=1 Tax=Clostridium botulinum TaxID=1491 RepID=UPI00052B826A|nr:CTP--phosphocholine cytidylyltransferase [Clostridium botulinum]KGM96555.1 CTP:phosphocholine cytidylyltransferase [Clostridium botulinum D str. CCUG 7971]KOC48479.1 CTP:phosphocholine cytidylyltransferase [Clostridium botulinum]NFO98717.1 CTP--phosphocholine cytidylyltransferase [Clostridium botulinum]OOV50624.1 CTP--phosphocholine cytidylyltransferase [Clostridium botulinum D/C]OOV55466.1 CTP--phosphocholine cytidylyltransferase [Clostridium botulinum D/C]
MRAIILAAGKGTRLRPLTENIPKPLVKVNGKPIIERQIECLIEKGIQEIIIVTGYLAEQFNYIQKKYDYINIKLVHNENYDKFNNIYTMYLVKEYLKDTYVLDGDIYINRNFIKSNIKESTYFGINKNNFQDEWIIYEQNNRIVNINLESAVNEYKVILSGVSYWSAKDGILIKDILKETLKTNMWTNLYWDNIVKDNLNKVDVFLFKINSNDCFEIDNLKDLKKVEKLVLA